MALTDRETLRRRLLDAAKETRQVVKNVRQQRRLQQGGEPEPTPTTGSPVEPPSFFGGSNQR